MINNFTKYKIADDTRAKFFSLYSLIINHESVSKHNNSPYLNFVFESLIEFVWVANIGDWHRRNNELRPWIILDDHPGAGKNLE